MTTYIIGDLILLLLLLLLVAGSDQQYSPPTRDRDRNEWRTRDYISSDREKEVFGTVNIDNNYPRLNASVTSAEDDIPDELDYRTMGYVSSVDNQGSCNACWAFVVTGAVEGLMARKSAEGMRKLSAQQLLDCTGAGSDCRGGRIADAMAYVRDKGLMTACDYGYEAEKKACRYQPNSVAFKIKSFMGVENLNEFDLKRYIATIGPGIVNFLAPPSLIRYKGGIYSTDNCYTSQTVLHSALLVGYGSVKNDKDYWILKDSFGIKRGENGYIRFERNIGLCGIGTYNMWPDA